MGGGAGWLSGLSSLFKKELGSPELKSRIPDLSSVIPEKVKQKVSEWGQSETVREAMKHQEIVMAGLSLVGGFQLCVREQTTARAVTFAVGGSLAPMIGDLLAAGTGVPRTTWAHLPLHLRALSGPALAAIGCGLGGFSRGVTNLFRGSVEKDGAQTEVPKFDSPAWDEFLKQFSANISNQ